MKRTLATLMLLSVTSPVAAQSTFTDNFKKGWQLGQQQQQRKQAEMAQAPQVRQAPAAPTQLSVRQLMTPSEFAASGLAKLSSAEHAALDAWLFSYTETVFRVARDQSPRPLGPSRTVTGSATSYEVEVSHNDELFLVNGNKYKAKTYCFGVEAGDRVVFLEGSPLGALGGHFKTGHSRTGQNRPPRWSRDRLRITAERSPGASRCGSSSASFVDRT